MTVTGIDVSAFQGTFDWANEKDIAFAGIRATSWMSATSFVADDDLKDNANHTWDVFGGKVVRIYYHETRPAVSAPDAQAAQFLAVTGRHLCRGDVLAVAMGDNGGSGTLTPSEIAAWHEEFLHRLRELTDKQHRVLAYCNPAWAQGGNCAGLGGWPLWLAQYDVAEPTVPDPWPHRHLILWQPSGTGLDRDVYMQGDRAHLNGWAGMPTYRR